MRLRKTTLVLHSLFGGSSPFHKHYSIFLYVCLVMAGDAGAQNNYTVSLSGNPLVTTGWTYGGAASVAGNTMILTNNSSAAGYYGYVYHNTPLYLSQCSQFTVSFDFQINNPSGGTTHADGISFYYLVNPPNAFGNGSSIGLPDYANGFALLLDTYSNDMRWDNPRVSLHALDGRTWFYDEGNDGTLVSNLAGGQSYVTDGNWHTCVLTYNNGNLSVSMDGGAPVVAGFYNINFRGYFGFAASIGGFASQHQIRNVLITGAIPPNPPYLNKHVINYCQNDVPSALTPYGTYYKWYDVPNGGTAVPVPTPSTATSTTKTWYVEALSISNGCYSLRSEVEVVVDALPLAPVVTNRIEYCVGATASALSATGTNLKWYTSPATGSGNPNAPVPSTASPGTTSYYVSQKNAAGCEGPRARVDVVVNAPPSPPIAVSPVNWCEGATAAALTATGLSLQWYTDPATGTGSTTAPVPATISSGTTSYYVSQTSAAGCEGARRKIDVVINPNPQAPGVTSPIAWCAGATATALTATGTSLKWYAQPASGPASTAAPVPSTAAAGTTPYYVSQSSAAGCESPRSQLDVVINPLPAPPIATSPVVYCEGATATALVATGNALQWYTQPVNGSANTIAPVPSTAQAGRVSYYASQMSAVGCEGARQQIEVIVNPTPAVPQPSWNGPLCEEQTLQLAATSSPGASFSWTGPAAFNSLAQNPSIAYATPAVSGNYKVTATIGNCSAQPASLAVLVKPKPLMPQASANTPVCEGFPLQLTVAVVPGANYSWTGPAGFTAASPITGIAHALPVASGAYQVIATVNGCHSETAITQVLVNPTPATPFIKEQNNKTKICAGEKVVYTALSPDATDYSWSTGGDGNTLTTGKGGSYQARAISAAGCISPASNTLSLIVHPLPAGTIGQTMSGAGVTRSWRLQAPLGASYLWSTGETVSVIVVRSSGDYSVTVTSDAGCKEIFNTQIGPQPLSIPNTFSPNGDGINDYWTIPELKNYPNAIVTIINRDGQTVFEAGNFTRWDGRINGKPLPAGVFFYIVRTSADAEPYKGWLNLIR